MRERSDIMDNKIETVSEALDILDDFMEELDETCGLSALKYGDEAAAAMDFLHDWLYKTSRRDKED